jgi:hypothetical protein
MSIVLAIIATYSIASIVVTIAYASFANRSETRASKALERIEVVSSAKRDASKVAAMRETPGSKLSPARS